MVPLDPSLAGARIGAKIGFDCTIPFGKRRRSNGARAAGDAKRTASAQSVAEVLAEQPASFLELMAALGTRDGREMVRELDKLYTANRLGRLETGQYVLKDGSSPAGRA